MATECSQCQMNPVLSPAVHVIGAKYSDSWNVASEEDRNLQLAPGWDPLVMQLALQEETATEPTLKAFIMKEYLCSILADLL